MRAASFESCGCRNFPTQPPASNRRDRLSAAEARLSVAAWSSSCESGDRSCARPCGFSPAPRVRCSASRRPCRAALQAYDLGMLYGRDTERAQIGALLEDARASRSGALIVRGEPGVGKTALLEDTRERAADMHILIAR